jgi:hypothetical protein
MRKAVFFVEEIRDIKMSREYRTTLYFKWDIFQGFQIAKFPAKNRQHFQIIGLLRHMT